MTIALKGTIDHGMWRGRHTWTVTFDIDGQPTAVNAHGDTEREAIADAHRTVAAMPVLTQADREQIAAMHRALFGRMRDACGRRNRKDQP